MVRDEAIYEAITTGNRERVRELGGERSAGGADLAGVLNGSMIPAMREIGERFSRGEAYVPEMLVAARAMQTGLDLIEPLLAGAGHAPRGRVCVGTVKGDLHDIGKNLVVMMLKGAGYEVMDLGVNCTVEKFDQAVRDGAQVVCLSALLTTTMPYMKVVTAHFAGRDGVKVVVGGAAVSQAFADEVGADGYGADANEAVRVVDRCLAAD